MAGRFWFREAWKSSAPGRSRTSSGSDVSGSASCSVPSSASPLEPSEPSEEGTCETRGRLRLGDVQGGHSPSTKEPKTRTSVLPSVLPSPLSLLRPARSRTVSPDSQPGRNLRRGTYCEVPIQIRIRCQSRRRASPARRDRTGTPAGTWPLLRHRGAF